MAGKLIAYPTQYVIEAGIKFESLEVETDTGEQVRDKACTIERQKEGYNVWG